MEGAARGDGSYLYATRLPFISGRFAVFYSVLRMRGNASIRSVCWAAWVLTAVFCLRGTEMVCRTNSIRSADVSSEFVVRSWTTEEGLPQNTVLSLLRSSDGYLWVGTLDGLARFDGLKFTIFDQQNTPAFRSQAVLALAEAPLGCLWIGMRDGLVQYSNHVFRYVPLGTTGGPVRSLCPRRQGGLWVGTDAGLMRLEEGEVVHYKNYSPFSIPSPSGGARPPVVNCVMEDPNGTLWVSDECGVARLQPSTNQFEYVYSVPPGQTQRTVGANTLVADGNGGLWFGNPRGLFHFGQGRLECYPTNGNAYGGDPDPLVWDGRGLWFTSVPRGTTTRWEADRLVQYRLPGGLAGECLNCMVKDVEGNLWAGTGSGGVVLMRQRRIINLTTADGLANDDTWCIAEAPDRSLWIATHGGLSHYTTEGKFVTYRPMPFPADVDRFDTVLVTRSGAVWAGCGVGLSRIEGQKLVAVPAEIGTERFKLPVQSLYEDPAGALWVGSGNLFRLKDGKWVCWGRVSPRARTMCCPTPAC